MPWNLVKSDRHVVDPNDQGYKIQASTSIIASLTSTLATALTTSTLIMKGKKNHHQQLLQQLLHYYSVHHALTTLHWK